MQELGRMIKKLCSKLFSRIVITGVLILIQAAWFWSQLDGSFHDHAGAGRFALPAVGR